MRLILRILLMLAPLASAPAEGIPREEYRARRTELRKSLEGVMVLYGANQPDDLHIGFFQDPDFLYLSGWKEPDAVMLLTPKEEILFLPPRNFGAEKFTGPKLDPDDPTASEKTGFNRVLPIQALERTLQGLPESSKCIYLEKEDLRNEKLRRLDAFRLEVEAAPTIARLRMIKSPAEVDLIVKSTDATVAAHLAAWSKIKPGVPEYEIAALMTKAYSDRGCERSAYAPTVASGPNSIVLHYSANRRRMNAGEIVLMDVGAECSDYATDVTRTVPVNGKFTSRQREIYDIVLGAQKAAIAAIKPGIKLFGQGSLQQIAYDYINTHGHDVYGEPLGKDFIHGLSHHVGLYVHDPADLEAPLQAGMVITVEPGIYLPEENFGVRIEDTVLVTATGAKNLSEALPRDSREIERLIGK